MGVGQHASFSCCTRSRWSTRRRGATSRTRRRRRPRSRSPIRPFPFIDHISVAADAAADSDLKSGEKRRRTQKDDDDDDDGDGDGEGEDEDENGAPETETNPHFEKRLAIVADAVADAADAFAAAPRQNSEIIMCDRQTDAGCCIEKRPERGGEGGRDGYRS